ncbi:CNNM domain-containing protein [Candidatus Latescibacterota bacterium]
MSVLILYLFLALFISFFCSLLESVLLSITHTHIALLIKDKRKSGSILRTMKKNINHPLAAILTLNTVANTVGAAGVGAQAFLLYGSEWVAVASGTLTILILVFSEIIPKTLGAVYWKQLSPFAAYLLKGLIALLLPVVFVLEKISAFIARKGTEAKITREELKVLAEFGVSEGILHKKDALILENLLLLREIKTVDILTPRSVVFALQVDTTLRTVISEHMPIRFSRIPVYGESFDSITGFVLKSELIETFYTGGGDDVVGNLAKPIQAIPGSRSIADLLDDFISQSEHIFLVVDEFGGTAGIVTLEDAVETLLGVEIVDEFDSVEDMRAHALDVWKKKRRSREEL